MSLASRRPRPAGMTLTELLVVMAIILIVSVATLPTVVTALSEREVSEASGIVQAYLTATRDRASGTGEPAGVRLLPDPDATDPALGIIAANRMVPLEQAPSYSEGKVDPERYQIPGTPYYFLAAHEVKVENGLPLPPTSFFYNIRQGDTIRFGTSGVRYKIAGPITTFTSNGGSPDAPGVFVVNPERFLNLDDPINNTPFRSIPTDLTAGNREFLYLLNGRDDDGDGYIDEAFDGIDNDGDGIIDPGFNGIDDNNNGAIDEPMELLIGHPSGGNIYTGTEYESEQFISDDFTGAFAVSYSIERRPTAALGAREIVLPAGAVIDLTTSGLGRFSERSRVPIDPYTGYVDLLFYPNGRVIPSTPHGLKTDVSNEFPFFLLWIADREDLAEPTVDPPYPLRLPITSEAAPTRTRVLEGERRLVTVSPTTGHSSVSPIAEFGIVQQTIAGFGVVQPRDLPYVEALRNQRGE